MDKVLLRVGEAADFLSVSRWTIYRWVEEGRLRGTKIGRGSLRIFHESIAGLVQNNQVDIIGALPNAKRGHDDEQHTPASCQRAPRAVQGAHGS